MKYLLMQASLSDILAAACVVPVKLFLLWRSSIVVSNGLWSSCFEVMDSLLPGCLSYTGVMGEFITWIF